MEIEQAETKIEERLPWHKPEVQRLVISIDTRIAQQPGSSEDGPTIG